MKRHKSKEESNWDNAIGTSTRMRLRAPTIPEDRKNSIVSSGFRGVESESEEHSPLRRSRDKWKRNARRGIVTYTGGLLCIS